MARYLKEEKTGVGPRVRDQREKRGWSQDELAQKLHIERNTLGMKECGKRSFTPEELLHLSDIFGITVDEMLTGVKTKSWSVKRDLGLNDDTVETFRSFKKNNPQEMMDYLNNALSYRFVLEALAHFMAIPKEQGNMRMLEATYLPERNLFNCVMSPDAYDSVMSYELINSLRLARSGEYMEAQLPPMTREQLDRFYAALTGEDQNGEEK